MNPDAYQALLAVLEYLEDDEEKNWEESGRPSGHIYNSIRTLRNWIVEENLED